MNRIVQTLLLLAATTSLALVQSSAKDSPAAPSSDVQTITQMENDWATALIKADAAFLDRIEAPCPRERKISQIQKTTSMSAPLSKWMT